MQTVNRLFFGLLLLTVSIMMGFINSVVHVAAQPGEVVWSEPVLLSDPDFKARSASAAVDIAGNIHVIWNQNMADEGVEGDTLFYSRWDGKAWSPAIDVLVTPDGGGADYPELVTTLDGMLHAVWNTGGLEGTMMYARAPACCAENVKMWSKPRNLGSPANTTVAMVADEQGRLHAAFATWQTAEIVYRRSDDGGNTWPVWVEIEGGAQLGDDYAIYPRLAVDKRGRVHAVWDLTTGFSGRRVMYTRSDDGGDSWFSPSEIDNRNRKEYREGYGPTLIDIEAIGEDGIHVIWDGAPTVERNHIWSADGGDTWSDPTIIFPISGAGRSGWNDMVTDSTGALHAFTLGGPWHAKWSNGRWSVPVDISPNLSQGGVELVQAAIGLGNQLAVVWTDVTGTVGNNNEVWVATGEILAAPVLPAQPLPTVELSPTPTTKPTIDATSVKTLAAVTPTRTRPNFKNSPREKAIAKIPNDPAFPVLVGVIPALVITTIVIFTTRHWLRSK